MNLSPVDSGRSFDRQAGGRQAERTRDRARFMSADAIASPPSSSTPAITLLRPLRDGGFNGGAPTADYGSGKLVVREEFDSAPGDDDGGDDVEPLVDAPLISVCSRGRATRVVGSSKARTGANLLLPRAQLFPSPMRFFFHGGARVKERCGQTAEIRRRKADEIEG